MTMSRSNRSADHDWDDRDAARPRPGSLPIRAVELAMRNPVTSAGVAVSLLMVAVTVANAVGNQPARHPHPWFETRTTGKVETRPAAATAPAALSNPAAPGLPNVLPRPKPISALDDGLVRDLQTALAERGFYAGPVDGVVGPATAEAIKACERRLGATPTGEPSELLLAALRAAPSIVAQTTPPPVAQPAPRQSAVPAKPVAAQPAASPPTPSMRVAAVDAVAYPAPREELVETMEVDTPVFTGSIRRAAREPLAQGGDEKLQKLQRALIAAGYGPLKADGRWDDRSISAVRRYEADRGWTVTGKPSDKLVWDLMGKVAKSAR
jgi:peptidoglycan hydrolase-like protein with peptidoglycan-binding domain